MSSDGRLGCADTYTPQVLFAPRNVDTDKLALWNRTVVPNITSITWGRELNDTAEATITIATQNLSDECCALISELDYWVHEIRLWRDDAVVFEGPITKIEYRTQGGGVTITVNDVSDWFNPPWGLLNTQIMNYTTKTPVVDIAVDIVTDQLFTIYPEDHPIIVGYIDTIGAGRSIKYKRGAVNEHLADTIADLGQYGLDWTTVGRSLIYMSRATSTNRRPVARLSDEDIVEPITVVRDGHEFGSIGWGAKENDGVVTREAYGYAGNYYGRHDRLIVVNDAEADGEDLLEAAKNALAGRNRPQVSINMGGTNTLRATAPITMDQLVCGQVLRFETTDLCRPVQALLMIAEVAVEWVPGMERVQVNLTQLGDVEEIPTEV